MRTLQTYLPLSGEVTVTGGDTEDETVELWEFVGGDDRVVGLGGGVHLLEHRLGERLRDPSGLVSTAGIQQTKMLLTGR